MLPPLALLPAAAAAEAMQAAGGLGPFDPLSRSITALYKSPRAAARPSSDRFEFQVLLLGLLAARGTPRLFDRA